MKFDLFVGTTILMFGGSIVGVEAQTINVQDCGLVENCGTVLNKTVISTPVANNVNPIENPVNSILLPEGKVSTVSSLTSIPQGNAYSLKNPQNSISQSNPPVINPPTDSNGNPLFRRANRSGPSYIGVGANFGITGESNIGDRSLAIISKLGLTETVSVRPSVFLFNDFASILLPITYDFVPQQIFDGFTVSPYLGGGAALATGTNSSVGFLITGGIDFPISSIFTVNVGANLALLRTTDLGIVIGLGYNF
jgi:hypothetical protein